MVKKGLTISYFGLDPSSDVKEYNFVTHEKVVSTFLYSHVLISLTCVKAELEFEVLKNVQELVENNYVDGRPRHHLPEARQIPFTPDSSVFFIIDYPDFMKLSAQDIHYIARTRHIVVENVPQEDFTWSLETLALLGDLKQNREIQGMYLCPFKMSR
jgi:uncharacterized protein YuzB (UPF0349 family)